MLEIGLYLALLVTAPQVASQQATAPQATAQQATAQQTLAQQTPVQPRTDPDYLRVVVHGTTGLVDRLITRGFDAREFPAIGRRRVAAEVTLDERLLAGLRRFAGAGNVMVLERSRPLRDIVASRRGTAGPDLPPDARYHTPAEINTDLLNMEKAYPAIALRVDLNARYSVGLTHGNRRIYALKISDNPAKSEDEPAMLLVTNHHAREINTVELALHSATQLLQGYGSDPKLKKLIDGSEIWIVPTMNPDGLSYVWTNNNMWRKNRRNNGGGVYGVDQNRNYPYFWSRCGSSTNPGSETYHGPAAGSEPETQVMLALGRAEVFERMLDVHSYGRDVRYGYNRLTGSRLPSGLKSFLDKIQGEVATAMSYRTNSSCCCGGDQHWHLAENGSLAYLAEMDTAFQPSWAQTQTEIVRVWNGVRHVFERAVPLRGHLLSLAGDSALGGELEVVGQPLIDGQKRRSSPRHGRYAVWLPTGTYDLLFKATGHVSRTVRVSLVDGQTKELDVRLVPTMRPTVLSSRGIPKLGTTMFFDVSSPDDASKEFIVGAAFGGSPGITIGPRTVPLNNDALLASMWSMPTVFVNAFGKLSPSGVGTMNFVIPAIPVLRGLDIHFCGITLDNAWPSSVKGISNGLKVTLQN